MYAGPPRTPPRNWPERSFALAPLEPELPGLDPASCQSSQAAIRPFSHISRGSHLSARNPGGAHAVIPSQMGASRDLAMPDLPRLPAHHLPSLPSGPTAPDPLTLLDQSSHAPAARSASNPFISRPATSVTDLGIPTGPSGGLPGMSHQLPGGGVVADSGDGLERPVTAPARFMAPGPSPSGGWGSPHPPGRRVGTPDGGMPQIIPTGPGVPLGHVRQGSPTRGKGYVSSQHPFFVAEPMRIPTGPPRFLVGPTRPDAQHPPDVVSIPS